MRKSLEYDEAEADEAEAYEPPDAYEDEYGGVVDEGDAFFGPDPLLDRWDDDPQ